jgi:hypothetical protein
MAAVVLLAASAAPAQNLYGWTISNSSTNPFSNSGPIGPGPSMFAGNLYLWLACNVGDGASAVEFAVEERRGAGLPTGFTHFGFPGPPSVLPDIVFAFPCATAPVLAGVFTVGADAFVPDIELCLVPSLANNRNVTVDCVQGLGWPNTTVGFAKTGGATCVDLLCGPPVSTEQSTWGGVKSLYR